MPASPSFACCRRARFRRPITCAAQDRLSGRAILVSAIDNLVKGASGQAVQDMNVMLGIPEITGLQQEPLFP
jgi:N-acetyl-gamma-glutamyl-phosphate reductase